MKRALAQEDYAGRINQRECRRRHKGLSAKQAQHNSQPGACRAATPKANASSRSTKRAGQHCHPHPNGPKGVPTNMLKGILQELRAKAPASFMAGAILTVLVLTAIIDWRQQEIAEDHRIQVEKIESLLEHQNRELQTLKQEINQLAPPGTAGITP